MTKVYFNNFVVKVEEGLDKEAAKNLAIKLVNNNWSAKNRGFFDHTCGMTDGLFGADLKTGSTIIVKAPTMKAKAHHGEIITVTKA